MVNTTVEVTCWSLTSVYAFLGLNSCLQIIRLWQNVNCGSLQHEVHLICLTLSLVRIAFFLVASQAWDVTTGEVDADKLLFYGLDELATILFFVLSAVVTLFLAQLYYLSIADVSSFGAVIKPAVRATSILAVIGIILCSYYISLSDDEVIYYAYTQYTFVVSIIYTVSAGAITYYLIQSNRELASSRNDTQGSSGSTSSSSGGMQLVYIRGIAILCTLALMTRVVILIFVTEKPLETTSPFAVFLVISYYLFLEVIPMGVIQLYYRVVAVQASSDDENWWIEKGIDDYFDDGNNDSMIATENDPLVSARAVKVVSAASPASASKSQDPSTPNRSGVLSPNRTPSRQQQKIAASVRNSGHKGASLSRYSAPNSAPPHVVDEVIARLSAHDFDS